MLCARIYLLCNSIIILIKNYTYKCFTSCLLLFKTYFLIVFHSYHVTYYYLYLYCLLFNVVCFEINWIELNYCGFTSVCVSQRLSRRRKVAALYFPLVTFPAGIKTGRGCVGALPLQVGACGMHVCVIKPCARRFSVRSPRGPAAYGPPRAAGQISAVRAGLRAEWYSWRAGAGSAIQPAQFLSKYVFLLYRDYLI